VTSLLSSAINHDAQVPELPGIYALGSQRAPSTPRRGVAALGFFKGLFYLRSLIFSMKSLKEMFLIALSRTCYFEGGKNRLLSFDHRFDESWFFAAFCFAGWLYAKKAPSSPVISNAVCQNRPY
jgi:hypothetical protein